MAATLESQLIDAAEAGNVPLVRRFLEAGHSVNTCDADRCSLLYIFASTSNSAGVRLCLDYQADLNQANADGFFPIHIAACLRDATCLRLLLACPTVDINARSRAGYTPLCYAAEEGAEECFRCLLAHGADPHARSSGGCTPLFLAAKGGRLDIVRELINAGADVNVAALDGATPIFEAARGGNPLVLVELRFHGADAFRGVSYGATPLHIAAFNGKTDCVRLLISWGANINSVTTEGCTPLHYAAYMGKSDVVRVLLALGCDASARTIQSEWSLKHLNFNKTALDHAAERYHCTDLTCVCHQQNAADEDKAACVAILREWVCRVPSLQDLCRRQARKQLSAASVRALAMPPNVKSYLLYEQELRHLRRRRMVVENPGSNVAQRP